MQPYYEDGSVTLYHGDCRDVLPNLTADVALTDPPYGIGKAARTYARRSPKVNAAPWDVAFHADWMLAASAVAPALGLMPGVVNLMNCPSEVGPWRYRWTLAVHVVNGMTRGAMGYGNWIPCLVYAADGVSIYRQASDAARIAVGHEPKPDHPSPKPYRVMSWLVAQLSSEGQTVVDPFAGSGTTLLAAKALGRKAVGVELEERYCDLIAQRLAQEVLPLHAA